METETWVPIAEARQYRLYDGYVTNCLAGMCKNPDAMCDALNCATVESGEFAITLKSALSILSNFAILSKAKLTSCFSCTGKAAILS